MKRTFGPKPVRNELLERIREGKFPRDAKLFSWSELESAGLIERFNFSPSWNDDTKKGFVLLATHAKEIGKECDALRKECDGLRRRVKLMEPYHSPLWRKVIVEPCLVKQSELIRQAQAEETHVNQERKKTNDLPLELFAALGRDKARRWEGRDYRRTAPRLEPVAWHEPKSVNDLSEAIGLSRRRVQIILNRIVAKPVRPRVRRNEPLRYDAKTNGEVLRTWLTECVKNVEDRRGHIARNLLHYKHRWPEQLKSMSVILSPAIASLKMNVGDFRAYLAKCEKILYPPQPSLEESLHSSTNSASVHSGR